MALYMLSFVLFLYVIVVTHSFIYTARVTAHLCHSFVDFLVDLRIKHDGTAPVSEHDSFSLTQSRQW